MDTIAINTTIAETTEDSNLNDPGFLMLLIGVLVHKLGDQVSFSHDDLRVLDRCSLNEYAPGDGTLTLTLKRDEQ